MRYNIIIGELSVWKLRSYFVTGWHRILIAQRLLLVFQQCTCMLAFVNSGFAMMRSCRFLLMMAQVNSFSPFLNISVSAGPLKQYQCQTFKMFCKQQKFDLLCIQTPQLYIFTCLYKVSHVEC